MKDGLGLIIVCSIIIFIFYKCHRCFITL